MLTKRWRTCCRCGAYARALQCYETYVRQVHGGGLNPAAVPASGAVAYQYGEVSFLLEVYSGLEEPDGLTGEGCLRWVCAQLGPAGCGLETGCSVGVCGQHCLV
jgi:hypothetical protein